MPDLPAAPQPAPSASPDLSRIASLLGVIVTILVVACLSLARAVLIPLTLGMLLSFLLAPLMRVLRMLRFGRAFAAIAAALFGLGLVLALAWLIGSQVAGLAANVPRYQATVEHKIESVREVVVDNLAALSRQLGQVPPPAEPGPASSLPQATPPASGAGAKPAAPAAAPPPTRTTQLGTAFHLAEQVLLPIASPLGTASIVFVISIFILLQREDLRDRLIRVFGSGDLHRTTIALDDIGRRLSHYYLALLAVNAGFGTAIGLGLLAIGVPSPLLWGVLAMLLRFVPYIGTPLAALLPLALAVAVAPGWSMALWTVVLFTATELTTSQAVEPFLYGRSTGLSPFAVIVAAIFWTWAWGPIGLLLSTPLTVCLVVLGRNVKRLEFLDVLLGNRPPLSVVENFYQRLLAGDPDEMQDHAEQLLREHALDAYYDDVAIKGLQLAAADGVRGVLAPERLARIRAAISALVRELDTHVDGAASGGSGKRPVAAPPGGNEVDADRDHRPVVLCIAGRGPLDDSLVEILAHLLRRAGLDPHPLPHAAASRARIAALDPHGVNVVALCYLDLAVAPAHLRFLLRRLRQQLPARPIVVGLAPADDPAMEVERLLATIGADRSARSLRGFVEACRDLGQTTHPPGRAAGAASPAAVHAAN